MKESPATNLQYTVKFTDGSEWVDVFTRVEAAVWSKKGYDYRTVYTSKFKNEFMPGDDMTGADMKKAFIAWLQSANPNGGFSVKFKYVPA